MEDIKEKKYKYFDIEDYKRVHNLVYEYQNGSIDAATEIIKSFEFFTNKYVNLIVHGDYSIENYSLRSFIKLFVIEKKDRSKINNYFVKPVGIAIANYTVNKIKRIFSSETEEDIRHSIYVTLLEMCSIYKDTKPSFHTFVKKNFHFYLFRQLQSTARDPIGRGDYIRYAKRSNANDDNTTQDNKIDIIPDENATLEYENVLNKIEIDYNMKAAYIPLIKTNKDLTIYDDDFLNMNWINGITCSQPFKPLTPFERNIVIMWYKDKKTDSYIATKYGVGRMTINKKRATAKQKILNEAKTKRIVK